MTANDMYDELTQADIDKMNEELEYRTLVLRPKILEEVKFTRSFGDLSENAEYHEAKRNKGRNDSRIRYLRNMIRTAKIISDESRPDEVGINDKVTFRVIPTGAEMTVSIVTSFGHDSLNHVISKESPVGKAVMGHKVGDRIKVTVSPEISYEAEITALIKGGALA